MKVRGAQLCRPGVHICEGQGCPTVQVAGEGNRSAPMCGMELNGVLATPAAQTPRTLKTGTFARCNSLCVEVENEV